MQDIQEFEKRLSSWMGRPSMTKDVGKESMRVMEWAPLVDITEDDKEYVIVRTSGSTGDPKEVTLKKSHMLNSARATGIFFKLGENTRALLCLPANFIAGKMMLVRAMTMGWDLHVVAPCDCHGASLATPGNRITNSAPPSLLVSTKIAPA